MDDVLSIAKPLAGIILTVAWMVGIAYWIFENPEGQRADSVLFGLIMISFLLSKKW